MADIIESRCTCRFKGRAPAVDLYAGSHSPWCGAWCSCPGGPRKNLIDHDLGCAALDQAEEA